MKIQYETVLAGPGRSFAAYETVGPAVDCEYHVHPELELVYVVSGYGSRFVNDSIAQFDVGPLNLIGTMTPHHFRSFPADSRGPDWSRLRVIQFRPELFSALFEYFPETAQIERLLAESGCGWEFPGEGAAKIGDRMAELIMAPGARRLVLLLEILEELSRMEHCRLSEKRLPEAAGEDGSRINRALRLIHSRVDRGETPLLTEVAAAAGLSPSAFSRYFARTAGRTFMAYVMELRVGKAAGMLLHTRRPVAEICFAAGFGNLSNFNRHFRRLRGISPREYRKHGMTENA